MTARLVDSYSIETNSPKEKIHCILPCKHQILHSSIPSFLSDPKSQPEDFDLSLRSLLSLLNCQKAKLKDWGNRDSAERWRDSKVIEDRISSSIVPHALQKAECCGENWRWWLQKIGLDAHHLDICCERQLDHEAGQFVEGDIELDRQWQITGYFIIKIIEGKHNQRI